MTRPACESVSLTWTGEPSRISSSVEVRERGRPICGAVNPVHHEQSTLLPLNRVSRRRRVLRKGARKRGWMRGGGTDSPACSIAMMHRLVQAVASGETFGSWSRITTARREVWGTRGARPEAADA